MNNQLFSKKQNSISLCVSLCDCTSMHVNDMTVTCVVFEMKFWNFWNFLATCRYVLFFLYFLLLLLLSVYINSHLFYYSLLVLKVFSSSVMANFIQFVVIFFIYLFFFDKICIRVYVFMIALKSKVQTGLFKYTHTHLNIAIVVITDVLNKQMQAVVHVKKNYNKICKYVCIL